METRVASVKMDDGVWMCGSLFHQHFLLIDGVGGGWRLLGADFVEHDNNGGINGTCNVEELVGDA